MTKSEEFWEYVEAINYDPEYDLEDRFLRQWIRPNQSSKKGRKTHKKSKLYNNTRVKI